MATLGSIVSSAVSGKELVFERAADTDAGIKTIAPALEKASAATDAKIASLENTVATLSNALTAFLAAQAAPVVGEVVEKTAAEKAAETRAANKAAKEAATLITEVEDSTGG